MKFTSLLASTIPTGAGALAAPAFPSTRAAAGGD
jgi:hypothetical protein